MAFYAVIVILLLQTFARSKENGIKEKTKLLNILSPTLADLDDKNIDKTQEEFSKNKGTRAIISHQDDQRQTRSDNFNGFQPFPLIYPTYASQYPIFLSVLYLAVSNCGCTPSEGKRPPQANPTQTQSTTEPTLPSIDINNVPEFGVLSRGPEVPDGVNESFIDDEDDSSRPISFDPIPPIGGIKKLPPPVEHGSVQGEVTLDN